VTDPNRPLLGEPNAPCRACGAPLAADQRYCLQCGTRRAEARLPFLEILARQVPASAAAAAETTTTRTTQSGPAAWLGRVSTNAAAVAGVACLFLALGVGVLIGGLGSDDASGSNAAPQIITVGGGSAAPAAAVPAATSSAPAATETTGDDATDASSSTGKSSKKGSASSSSSKSSSKPSAAVKDLEKTSGSDYTKKSEKLPKTLGTGGVPPPVDKSKPAGGGSDVEEIG
jgi:hypothetical protein